MSTKDGSHTYTTLTVVRIYMVSSPEMKAVEGYSVSTP